MFLAFIDFCCIFRIIVCTVHSIYLYGQCRIVDFIFVCICIGYCTISSAGGRFRLFFLAASPGRTYLY